MLALYPTLHRALQPSLNKLTLQYLAGSFPSTVSHGIIASAAQLHGTLHLAGGKVGGAAIWRKSLDEAIGTASIAIDNLTATFSNGGAFVVFHLSFPNLNT